MSIKLDTLINIIGKREVEELLINHLSKNYNKPTEPKAPRTNSKGHRVLGAKPWSTEDEGKLVQRANEMRPTASWTKIGKVVAAELYRTPSSIYNRISKLQKQGLLTK